MGDHFVRGYAAGGTAAKKVEHEFIPGIIPVLGWCLGAVAGFTATLACDAAAKVAARFQSDPDAASQPTLASD